MVLDSSDLQQRRTVAAPKRSTKKRPTNSRTSIRRRRRKSHPKNRSALVALAFALIAIPVVLITTRLLGKGNTNGSSGASNRIVQNWKSHLKSNRVLNSAKNSSVDELEFEERAKQREERYQYLYRPKFDESTLGYDIYNCPFAPPQDYPKAWKTTEVLSNWNPNDVTTLPPLHRDVYQGLCVFDYETQYAAALNYRNHEKPFVIRNDPKVTSVSRRWEDDPEYLHHVLGDVEEFRTERSPNNKFMWYKLRGKHSTPHGYHRPLNDEIEMTFGEWLEHAIEKDGKALGDKDMIASSSALKQRRIHLISKMREEQESKEDDSMGDDEQGLKGDDSEEAKKKRYYYFRLNADLKRATEASPSKFIYDQLTFFDPRKRRDSQFYIVDPKAERGINCRFGMRGVTAANHFDMSRNMIAVFGGERRYILASPTQCKNMALFPQGHPSVRHSSLDWSNPMEWDDHPEFKGALINEVVLHAGDVLYLPTCWFHFIVNLSLNYQCNARSGTTYEATHFIEDCGFNMPRDK